VLDDEEVKIVDEKLVTKNWLKDCNTFSDKNVFADYCKNGLSSCIARTLCEVPFEAELLPISSVFCAMNENVELEG
jgi:hypothetical protein